jgi:hypothetical protein
MFTMRPPPVLRIRRAPFWQQKNTAFRFTEWMKSQSASVTSSGSRRVKRAALFTRPSSRPSVLSISPNMRSISATLSRFARNSGAPPHSAAVARASASEFP